LTKILAQGGGGTGTTFKSEGIFIFMTYGEKLKDPRWQKKRLEILQRDNWTCRYCGSDKHTLHVHHFKYFKEPWDIENDKLITFCEDCHWLHETINSASYDRILEIIKRHIDNGKSQTYCRKDLKNDNNG
jgi:hypothetical protein